MSSSHGPRKPPGGRLNAERLDAIVARAANNAEARQRGYREQSLRLHPHVCGRCGRSFDRSNLHELTVHHKDHNHDNNPPDGSNWENLCLYCHDWEHQKYSQQVIGAGSGYGLTEQPATRAATHNPFADLKAKLEKSKK